MALGSTTALYTTMCMRTSRRHPTYVSRQHRLPPPSRLSCLVIRSYVPKQVRGGFHNAVTVPQVADCRQGSVELRGPRGSTTIRGFGIWTATCSDLKERDQHPANLHSTSQGAQGGSPRGNCSPGNVSSTVINRCSVQ
ncbi:uncharacterized protein B0T23DRAFT_193882 [Neurospora hispaniola]|uniref:Uncharacterized protein n=1 Tax=Neurospora hispaniola TaxID=588809 RepID=A0AAJ0MPD3_9PEZI|nr:hypothetical protein B0T23DRAFT_193882 [Neurospora hispaniola]